MSDGWIGLPSGSFLHINALVLVEAPHPHTGLVRVHTITGTFIELAQQDAEALGAFLQKHCTDYGVMPRGESFWHFPTPAPPARHTPTIEPPPLPEL